MKRFLITLLVITLVAFIGAIRSEADPQPDCDLRETVNRLDLLVVDLETLVAMQADRQRQHDHNLRRLAARARGDR